MRVLAVDYGDVRTGIAVSDMSQTLPGDAWVIKGRNIKETARTIADEAASRDVSCIVVGYPKNMDGSIGERAKKSESLADLIREISSVQVELWDERLTTADAHNVLNNTGKRGAKKKKLIDAVAASLILESYLNRR